MRGLIENLSPENRQIYWKWIGGVFALYVVMMAGAAGMLMLHQPAKSLRHESAVGTADRGKQRSVTAMHGASVSFAMNGHGG
jgi:hypothetical protein